MRILFTGMTANIHFARWVNQLAGLGWDIHVFGDNGGIHPDLQNVTAYKPLPRKGERSIPSGTRVKYWWPFLRGEHFLKHHLGAFGKSLLPEAPVRLARIIEKIQPDCIHTIKLQPYGYQVNEAREILGGKLPAPWIYNSWGRDTFMYQHDPEHLPRIKAALAEMDYYIADCQRDIPIAQALGFKGEILGVFPGIGGFDLDAMMAYRIEGPASKRRTIAIKGYQTDDGGQVLMALEGIRRVADLLREYTVVVHGAIGTYASKNFEVVNKTAQEIMDSSGIRIEFLPFVPHEEILKLFGRSRIGLSISRSDGTPVTMLEWLVMGAYPIESDTGGPAEWIQSGTNGAIVPFDNPDKIAEALRNALLNDDLVDAAALYNERLARERLDKNTIRPRVIEIYKQIVEKHARRI